MKNKGLWITIAALVIVIFYLVQCRSTGNSNVLPDPPKVKTEIVQQLEVKNNSDSIDAVIKPLEKELEDKDKKLTRLANELLDGQDAILKLQQGNDSLLSLLKASELTTSITESSEKIKEQIKKNDSICSTTISEYVRKSRIAEQILKSEKDKYKLLKKSFDTCTAGITALKKYSSDIKPRNKVLLGATAGFNPTNKEFAYGIAVQYSLKNGYAIQGSALQMKNSQMYAASIFKTISFRRK